MSGLGLCSRVRLLVSHGLWDLRRERSVNAATERLHRLGEPRSTTICEIDNASLRFVGRLIREPLVHWL